MAIDALGAALVSGIGDVGAVGAASAADVAAADVGAGIAADVGATTAADIGAAAVPDIAAGTAADVGATAADIGATGADVGLTGADVAATGADVGAAGATAADVGTLGAGTADIAGAGLGTDIGASTAADFAGGAPFTDVFSGGATGGDVTGLGSEAGTFGGGTQGLAAGGTGWDAFATPEGFTSTGPEAFGSAATSDTGPVVSDTGIVGSEGGLTGGGTSDASLFAGTPGYSTQETFLPGAGPVGPSDTLGGGSALGDLSNLGTGNITNVPTSFSGLGTEPATAFDPGFYSGAPAVDTTGQLATMEQVGVGPSYGPVMTSEEAFAAPTAAPLPAATEVGPGVVGAPGTPAATAATAATPSAAATPATAAVAPAAGASNALTALRAGTLGVNAVTAGINLSNALNQPSYPALLPQAYPGSPFMPGPNQPGYQATGAGGVRAGLASNRLASDLVSGRSIGDMVQSGLISPNRAQQLQTDYNGISDAYAKQLGVSPSTLSPEVKQVIAARALGESGLGGA